MLHLPRFAGTIRRRRGRAANGLPQQFCYFASWLFPLLFLLHRGRFGHTLVVLLQWADAKLSSFLSHKCSAGWRWCMQRPLWRGQVALGRAGRRSCPRRHPCPSSTPPHAPPAAAPRVLAQGLHRPARPTAGGGGGLGCAGRSSEHGLKGWQRRCEGLLHPPKSRRGRGVRAARSKNEAGHGGTPVQRSVLFHLQLATSPASSGSSLASTLGCPLPPVASDYGESARRRAGSHRGPAAPSAQVCALLSCCQQAGRSGVSHPAS